MAKILDASYFGSRMLFVSRKFCTWFYNRSDYSNCESKYCFGWFYAVLVFIMFTGESNGVNLSDGLDGLATGLSMVAIAPFIIYAIMIKDYTIASYATAMVGALLGFMYFNYHPARIFMGR